MPVRRVDIEIDVPSWAVLFPPMAKRRVEPFMSIVDDTISILLVEDQVLIAMDAEMMLGDAGFARLETATNGQDALAAIDRQPPALAVLDVNLGDHDSMSVADALQTRAIPFIFATAYSDQSQIPDRFQSVPVIAKPYDSRVLLAAVRSSLNLTAFLAP